jgi:hypothetical protein
MKASMPPHKKIAAVIPLAAAGESGRLAKAG